MGGNGTVADELHQLRDGRFSRFLVGKHHVGDAGDFGNLGLQRFLGIHQNAERIRYRAAHQLHSTDFDDTGNVGVQTGRLKIQHHNGRVEVIFRRICDCYGFIDQVALTAWNQLDVLSLYSTEGRREGLHYAVVGNGNGRVPPLNGTLDQILCRGHAVHGGHGGVHVQLNTLLFGGVLPLDFLHGHHITDGDGQLPGKVVVHALAPNLHIHAALDLVYLIHHGLPFLGGNGSRRRIIVFLGKAVPIPHEYLAQYRGGVVRNGKGH